jgi:xylulokinase
MSLPGDALLSLGTSTTFLLSIPPSTDGQFPKRFTSSHLLAHPTSSPEAQIAMLCYKNGALAREHVRNQWAEGSWDRYNDLVNQAGPGCGGLFGFYFPLPEIIPPGVKGNFFFALKGEMCEPTPQQEVDESLHPRLILESQFLSIKARISEMLPPSSPPLQRLILSGGSSTNPTIQQLAADLFDMRVYVSPSKEGAALGGALLAKLAWWKSSHPDSKSEDSDMMAEVVADQSRCVAEPRPELATTYRSLVEFYNVCETRIILSQGR